jgi:short-subunit dehydrogenase
MSLPKPRPGAAALVTGASAGIGEALARELAGRGYDLIIVARRKARLDALAKELSAEHGVTVETLGCDLASATSRARLPKRIESLGLEVDVLVNNAGFATGGRFQESDTERELDQVRVLCEAPVALASAFLPGMVERRSGAILNVASTAAFQPLPYSAGYSAAKAHALAFSEALHGEVSGVGVTVTALCPGPVKTEFWDVAGEQPIEAAMPDVMWVTPEQCAKDGVEGVASGDRVVVPGLTIKAGMTALRLLPNWLKIPASERLMRP